jgi:O-phospho-L-seryl-tRNASec:L-selenocysteinyl-tRNA synthase
MVRLRHYGFSHGIGRSGDVTAAQPKAPGSSLMYQLTRTIVLDLARKSGLDRAKQCLLLPVATGMAISLTLMTLKEERNGKFVIWPRVDQKTCIKAIYTAGLIPVVAENLLDGDEIVTDLEAVEKEILEKGSENILCIMSTTSCFAPRSPDDVIGLGKLCKKHNIPHLVNNAFGFQTRKICDMINSASNYDNSRVDVVIQSTDKNFMVPVGGSVIFGFHSAKPKNASALLNVEKISKIYPGRASISPIIDLLITLLSMGLSGWIELQRSQIELMNYFQSELSNVASSYGERVLLTELNPVSLGRIHNYQLHVMLIKYAFSYYFKFFSRPAKFGIFHRCYAIQEKCFWSTRCIHG